MPKAASKPEVLAAVHTTLTAIFLSLELSRKTWVITSLSPGAAEKMSKYVVPAGDVATLLLRFEELKRKAHTRTGTTFPIITIQEAGLDGFWLHRLLTSEGVESHVVDPASITVPRRRRNAKTDKIDGESLLRTLLAFKRGEPRVCAMVAAPTPEQEDERRLSRERDTLVGERTSHVNRIKGLLFSQGIADYEPINRDRRKRLEELYTGDGHPLTKNIKAAIGRELDRLELLMEQIKAVEDMRDALLKDYSSKEGGKPLPVPKALLEFKGIGPEFATVLWTEGLYRHFDNRRQLASYAGLAPTPWQSGSVSREQGVSKAGNARLRSTLVELSWLWVRHQPESALTRWFKGRVEGGRGKKTTIVAFARKLFVALWKYVNDGVVIEGAVMKKA
jgi:transposase